MDQEQAIISNNSRSRDQPAAQIPFIPCIADGHHFFNQITSENQDIMSNQSHNNYQHQQQLSLHDNSIALSSTAQGIRQNNDNEHSPQFQQQLHSNEIPLINNNQQFSNFISNYQQQNNHQINAIIRPANHSTHNFDSTHASNHQDLFFASLSAEASLNHEIINQHLTASASISNTKQQLNRDNVHNIRNLYDCEDSDYHNEDGASDNDEQDSDNFSPIINYDSTSQRQQQQISDIAQSSSQNSMNSYATTTTKHSTGSAATTVTRCDNNNIDKRVHSNQQIAKAKKTR